MTDVTDTAGQDMTHTQAPKMLFGLSGSARRPSPALRDRNQKLHRRVRLDSILDDSPLPIPNDLGPKTLTFLLPIYLLKAVQLQCTRPACL